MDANQRPDRPAVAGDPPLDLARLRELVPALGTNGLGAEPASGRPLAGKILTLKLGFNPNSSSVGTTVVVLLWTAASSGAVLSLVAAVLAHRLGRSAPPLADQPGPPQAPTAARVAPPGPPQQI